MKVVIAPDSYKESLSALEVATQIEAGFREVFPTGSTKRCRLPTAVKVPSTRWWPPPAGG